MSIPTCQAFSMTVLQPSMSPVSGIHTANVNFLPLNFFSNLSNILAQKIRNWLQKVGLLLIEVMVPKIEEKVIILGVKKLVSGQCSVVENTLKLKAVLHKEKYKIIPN